jgi:stage V sporulation protein G
LYRGKPGYDPGQYHLYRNARQYKNCHRKKREIHIIGNVTGRGFNMQITDVRVRRIEKEGKMKAIVSITLDNEFVIHDIKVIEGEKGLFIAMPSRKAADGEYRDIAHPINSGTRDMIQKVILDKYETTALEMPEAVAAFA